MKVPKIHAIVAEVNRQAGTHPIGQLQDIRAELHHRRRAGRDIFSKQTTFSKPHDRGAFHRGGATELQFNLWLVDDFRKLRHGVAFSLKRRQTLPDPVGVLGPKVKLFNEFMRGHSELYRDMRMWHYKDGTQSKPYMPAPIRNVLVQEGVFVFLGKLQPVSRIDYETILNDFDRLLELYKFTEGGSELQTDSLSIQIEFCPGFKPKASKAIVTQVRKQMQLLLRHNRLQKVLYRKLVSRFGHENVRAEFTTVLRKSVDVVVRRGNTHWFYEIKTADSARACLREALGQILEYAFCPEGLGVSRLIVVGEPAIDKQCEIYLQVLKERFSLPIEYHRIKDDPA